MIKKILFPKTQTVYNLKSLLQFQFCQSSQKSQILSPEDTQSIMEKFEFSIPKESQPQLTQNPMEVYNKEIQEQKQLYSTNIYSATNKPQKEIIQYSQKQQLKALTQGKQIYKKLSQTSPPELNKWLIKCKEKQKVDQLQNLMSYIRKTGKSSSFQTHVYKQSLEIISDNLPKLNSIQVAAYSFNLMRMKHNEAQEWNKLAFHVSMAPEKYSIRELSNIVYSFSYIQRKSSETSFFQFFRHLETVLALKFASSTDFNGKDLSQVIMGYSKSQTVSREFLYVLEQVALQNFANFNAREIAEILYTLATKNNYNSQNLAEKAVQHFIHNQEKYKIQEIVHLLHALQSCDQMQNEEFQQKFANNNKDSNKEISNEVLHQFLDIKTLKVFENCFIVRGGDSNILDIADIAQVFFQKEFVQEDFIALIRGNYKQLRKNIDSNVLIKFFTNIDNLLNKELIPNRFFKELMKTLAIQIKNKQFKGRYIAQLKESAKNIEHVHFRKLVFDTLKGNVKTIYEQLEEKKQQEITEQDIRKARKKKSYKIEQIKKNQQSLKK